MAGVHPGASWAAIVAGQVYFGEETTDIERRSHHALVDPFQRQLGPSDISNSLSRLTSPQVRLIGR